MDRFTVYCRTDAGDRALAEANSTVDRAARKVLEIVDGFATVGEISTRIGNPKAVQRALTELERTAMVETLDARMARLTEQEAQWLQSASEMGGRVEPGMPDFDSGPATDFSQTSKPEPVKPARKKKEEARDVLASGSRATLMDQIRTFWGTLGHRMLKGGGSTGKKLRRWFVWTVLLGVVGGIAAAVVSLGWQVSTLRGRVEIEAAQWLGEPVKIGGASVSFHPWPSYELKDIQIGEGGTTRVEAAWGQPDWIRWMLGQPQRLSLTFRGGSVNPALLVRLAGLPPPGHIWRLSEVDFSDIAVPMGTLNFPGMHGSLTFSEEGRWALGRAHSAENVYTYELTPRNGILGLNVVSKEFKLGASSKLENLYLDGSMTPASVTFTQQSANYLGGAIKGRVDFDLTQGVRMKAQLSLNALGAEALGGLVGGGGILIGNVSGPVTVTSEAADIAGLFPAAKWEGAFSMGDGVLGKIDLVEALRRNGSGAIAGGATRFTRLEGAYLLQPGKPTRIDIRRLESGALSASGRVLLAEDGNFSGSFHADLRTSVEHLGRSFSVGGNVVTPQLKPAGE